jgi:hypothetical protein
MAVTYQNGSITVDEDFARFGSKTYSIDKINTVDVRVSVPSQAGWIILGLLGIGFFLPSALAGELVMAFFGIVLLGAAYIVWRGAQLRTYKLFLVTSSSEAQAFETRDEGEISQLRSAIEQAIIRQKQTKRS